MQVDIITLFPEIFAGPLDSSVLGKAKERGLLHFNLHRLFDFSTDKHSKVDDTSYGGGVGMVLKYEPVKAALDHIFSAQGFNRDNTKIILLTPQGESFVQKKAKSLSGQERLVFICGRYEGFDERIRSLVDLELSIGDYVLTGGELPALVVIDSVARYIKGVVGDSDSVDNDSFSNGLLDFPHYTKPEEIAGQKVPEELISGDHKRIELFRREESFKRTLTRRPDLLRAGLPKEYKEIDIVRVIKELAKS